MSYIAQNFKNWTPVIQKYQNGRIAIEYVSRDAETGYEESEVVATVNLPDEECGPDEVWVKNWSENEGILELMQEAGHISDIVDTATTGWVQAYKCKVLLPTATEI